MNFKNNDLETKLNFALANIEKNNLEKASSIYKKILIKYPNNFDANFNLGTIFAKKNNLEKSVELLEKAASINPNLETIFNNLGLIYLNLGNTEKALENLQYYIEKKSMKNHADEINNMIVDLRTKLAKKEFETAKLYIRIEEYKAAEIYFENIINEYYDTDFFDNSVFNLSLLQFVNGKDSSIKLFESNKDSFINFDNYNQWFEILNTLNENEEISYYVKQIK